MCHCAADAAGGPGLEPSRSSLHHDATQGRRDRLLHVSQLRKRPQQLRDADRQLHPAAGRLRRPQLLRDGSQRSLRNPRGQQRRRGRGHQLPVSLQEQPCRHRAARRRQERLDPADPGGRIQCRQQCRLEREGDVHTRRCARRSPGRRTGRGHQRGGWGSRVHQTGRLHRHEDLRFDRRIRSVCGAIHLHGQHPRLRRARPGVRRPAQGFVRRQPRPHVRPAQPESARLQWRHRRPGRQECHHARAGGPRVLPDGRAATR